MASNKTPQGMARLKHSLIKKRTLMAAAAITQFRSFCHTDNEYLGDDWYSTHEEAARNHDGHRDNEDCRVEVRKRTIFG